jgi:hypothetical protein
MQLSILKYVRCICCNIYAITHARVNALSTMEGLLDVECQVLRLTANGTDVVDLKNNKIQRENYYIGGREFFLTLVRHLKGIRTVDQFLAQYPMYAGWYTKTQIASACASARVDKVNETYTPEFESPTTTLQGVIFALENSIQTPFWRGFFGPWRVASGRPNLSRSVQKCYISCCWTKRMRYTTCITRRLF